MSERGSLRVYLGAAPGVGKTYAMLDFARANNAAQKAAGLVELRVIDHGPGMPLDDRARVFAAFPRRDHHDTGSGAGVGLGLAIARGFVEAMHGTITLDDTPGGGLIAVVVLAIAPSEAPA